MTGPHFVEDVTPVGAIVRQRQQHPLSALSARRPFSLGHEYPPLHLLDKAQQSCKHFFSQVFPGIPKSAVVTEKPQENIVRDAPFQLPLLWRPHGWTTVIVSVGLLSLSTGWADEPDWSALEQEAGALLSQYIQIDTTNPPGNEIAAANFWKDTLSKEGLEAQIFESQPGRGIVYARLKGSGEKKALILLHHMDVVPAVAANWDVNPFAGTIKDGHVHGRGAIDCKGVAVVQFLALALLKRLGITLKRDIIFLGTGDEEVGGRQGAGWFVANHLNFIEDAQFLLTEGGGIRLADNQVSYTVSVAEKSPCWIQLDAKGKPGHGSVPRPESAVNRLLRALNKIQHYTAPVKVVPAVQAYFSALAERKEDQTAEQYRNLEHALADPDFRREFTATPRHNALIRNTISPTVLNGSEKTNVVPAQATAELDCRLLPGEDPQQFIATLTEVIDDPQVELSVLLNFRPVASEAKTPLFQAIASVAKRHHPDALILPSMLTGFTDSHYFREKGIISYGFSGIALQEDESYGVHGPNERIPLASLREAIRIVFDILQELDKR